MDYGLVFIVQDKTLGRDILSDRESRLFVDILMKHFGVVCCNECEIADTFIC